MAVIDVRITRRTSEASRTVTEEVIQEIGTVTFVATGREVTLVHLLTTVCSGIAGNAQAVIRVDPVLAAVGIGGVAGGRETVVDVVLAARAIEAQHTGAGEVTH